MYNRQIHLYRFFNSDVQKNVFSGYQKAFEDHLIAF